jgi:uncharacterized protein (TIGR00255 family)
MTGFGSGEQAAAEQGKVSVELRAVNHRFLDVRVRAVRELGDMATFIEQLVRERFSRGRIEVSARGEALAAHAPVLDRDRAARAYRDLEALRDEVAPGEPVPLSLLAAVPDLFVAREGSSEALRDVLRRAFDAAAKDLDAMRAREGAALERDMREHLSRVVALAGDVERRAPDALVVTHDRLRERVTRLVATAETAAIDAARLEQEVAVLADRSDVVEEIARLRSHCEQLGAVLASDGPVGRRIDFLLQEMSREVNTIGSKSSDVSIARTVVELKVEVERLREQAQNVE